MNGLLFLLYCIEILGALLCGAQYIPGGAADIPASAFNHTTSIQTSTPNDPTSAASSVSVATTQSPTTISRDNSHDASPSRGPQPTTTTTATTTTTTTATTTTTITTPNSMFYRSECLPALMVAGGLIIACTILLVSTLLLVWKVCQLSRLVRMLSGNADLISTSEYWMGTAKRNKNASETEIKETTVLMTDINQTQEEKGNSTTKEEKVDEDGPKGEEKKVEDAAKSEDAPAVTVAENATKPQEEAVDSPSTNAAAASTAKDTEELKDVV